MNTALLTAMLVLGANPDGSTTLAATVTPLPTPVPVPGHPFVAARGLQPEEPGMGNIKVAALLALGNAPGGTLQIPLQRVHVVPVQPGIVGPVHLRAGARLPGEGRIGAPAIVDLRGSGA